MSKLPFEPRYDPHLDAIYGFTGRGYRSHSGLAMPMRYGLTRSQVQMLIDADLWGDFYSVWMSKRIRYLERSQTLCVACGRTPIKSIVIFGQHICKRCRIKIDKLMGATNGTASRRKEV